MSTCNICDRPAGPDNVIRRVEAGAYELYCDQWAYVCEKGCCLTCDCGKPCRVRGIGECAESFKCVWCKAIVPLPKPFPWYGPSTKALAERLGDEVYEWMDVDPVCDSVSWESQYLARAVCVTDGFLRLGTQASPEQKRFFAIVEQLPLELQGCISARISNGNYVPKYVEDWAIEWAFEE